MKDPLFWLRGKKLGPLGVEIVKTALDWKIFSPVTLQHLIQKISFEDLLLITKHAPSELKEVFVPILDGNFAEQLAQQASQTTHFNQMIQNIDQLEPKAKEALFQALQNYIMALEQLYYHGQISYKREERKNNLFFLLKLRFSDLLSLHPREIQTWLKEVDQQDLMALLTGHEEIKAYVFECLSTNLRKKLQDRLSRFELSAAKMLYRQQSAMLSLSKLIDRDRIDFMYLESDQIMDTLFFDHIFSDMIQHFSLSNVECQTFLQHMDKDALRISLSNVSLEKQQIFLSNLSQRLADDFKEDLNGMGPYSAVTIMQSRIQAIDSFVQCVQAKKITLTQNLFYPLQAALFSKKMILTLSPEDRALLFQDFSDDDLLRYFNPSDRKLLGLVLEGFEPERRKSVLDKHDQTGFFPKFFEWEIHQKICVHFQSLLEESKLPTAPTPFKGKRPTTLVPPKKTQPSKSSSARPKKKKKESSLLIIFFYFFGNRCRFLCFYTIPVMDEDSIFSPKPHLQNPHS